MSVAAHTGKNFLIFSAENRQKAREVVHCDGRDFHSIASLPVCKACKGSAVLESGHGQVHEHIGVHIDVCISLTVVLVAPVSYTHLTLPTNSLV